mmetsp:Transcript_15927/g.18605  ORF Transcript_15927/g.18605 Transcript_15927/m.18605 type:complete len:447 (-) Transcript_15927:862-2202(-)
MTQRLNRKNKPFEHMKPLDMFQLEGLFASSDPATARAGQYSKTQMEAPQFQQRNSPASSNKRKQPLVQRPTAAEMITQANSTDDFHCSEVASLQAQVGPLVLSSEKKSRRNYLISEEYPDSTKFVDVCSDYESLREGPLPISTLSINSCEANPFHAHSAFRSDILDDVILDDVICDDVIRDDVIESSQTFFQTPSTLADDLFALEFGTGDGSLAGPSELHPHRVGPFPFHKHRCGIHCTTDLASQRWCKKLNECLIHIVFDELLFVDGAIRTKNWEKVSVKFEDYSNRFCDSQCASTPRSSSALGRHWKDLKKQIKDDGGDFYKIFFDFEKKTLQRREKKPVIPLCETHEKGPNKSWCETQRIVLVGVVFKEVLFKNGAVAKDSWEHVHAAFNSFFTSSSKFCNCCVHRTSKALQKQWKQLKEALKGNPRLFKSMFLSYRQMVGLI